MVVWRRVVRIGEKRALVLVRPNGFCVGLTGNSRQRRAQWRKWVSWAKR